MFQIRRIFDDVLPADRQAIAEVQKMFCEHFSEAPAGEIEQLTSKLRNPFHRRFRTILCVAENRRNRVTGFAIVLHDPEVHFCYLDYLASGSFVSGRGVGAALYEYVRGQALGLEAEGLFFECLPDDPERCADEKTCRENAARLRFYERYGARPIVDTAYETPVPGGSDDNLPHLVYDDLDQNRNLRPAFLRQVVTAILERKYGDICPAEYVQLVVDSISADPVKLRPFRYLKKEAEHRPARAPEHPRILIAVNDQHEIHHIRERGYVESPVRIKALEEPLLASGMFEKVPVREFGLEHIYAVHDSRLVDYLKLACEQAPAGKSIYPYVFPVRNAARLPRDLSVHVGYYCIDTFTPIHQNAYKAARRAVDTTLTMADAVLEGARLAYSLVRPPGHHAESRLFGGFCYFNNAAVAAQYFSRFGRVAILDIDYHHGNGQQEIFYERNDVFTVSLHGDPQFAYPYFSGFADEQGFGQGLRFNLNLPLQENLTPESYLQALFFAVKQIEEFDPQFLIVALGLDPAKGDPTGTWSLLPRDFAANGRLIGRLNLPTLVVQEGGYRTRSMGACARHFFQGLLNAHDH